MRVVLGPALVAVVLFGAGAVCWRAGELEARMANAHEGLAMLQYGPVADEYGGIEASVGFAGRLPWVTDTLLSEIHQRRASADYWRSQYDTLIVKRDNSGDVEEEDPAILLLAANAEFRASQRHAGDRQAVLRGLDATLKTYGDVLRKDPGNVDAAYNYEYIARLRSTIAKDRPGSPPRRDRTPTTHPQIVTAGDLPTGRTIHGAPGAPPITDMEQFKIHIPVRPDERPGGIEGGEGAELERKG